MVDASLEEMPLFPLGLPVLPTVTMPLRIFEQRYLRLVRDSLRESRPFGVVSIRSGREVGGAPSIHTWGTVVRIADWSQRDDGLLGIDIRGERVLQVTETRVEPDGLMMASVRVFPADDHRPSIPERFALLEKLLEDLTSHPAASVLRLRDGEDDMVTLGWRLAQLLPVSRRFHQALLQEHDPWVRLEMLEQAVADISER